MSLEPYINAHILGIIRERNMIGVNVDQFRHGSTRNEEESRLSVAVNTRFHMELKINLGAKSFEGATLRVCEGAEGLGVEKG